MNFLRDFIYSKRKFTDTMYINYESGILIGNFNNPMTYGHSIGLTMGPPNNNIHKLLNIRRETGLRSVKLICTFENDIIVELEKPFVSTMKTLCISTRKYYNLHCTIKNNKDIDMKFDIPFELYRNESVPKYSEINNFIAMQYDCVYNEDLRCNMNL